MNRHRGGPWVLSLVVAAVVFVPSPRAQAVVRTATINEVGASFEPRQLNVEVASATDEVDVVWSFVSSPSGSGHGVKFDDGTDLTRNCPAVLLSDCQTRPGQTVSRRLPKGTYPYYCKIHGGPGGVGMAGVIVITVAGPTSTSTTRGSTNPSSKDSTTSSTTKNTSSTTSTTRALATSSTVVRSSTTTSDTSSVLLPGDPPPFSSDDSNSSAAGSSGGSKDGSDSGTVALIVVALLAVSAGGGYLLWRLRPGRV